MGKIAALGFFLAITLKWLGKGFLLLTKYGLISTAVYLVYRGKTYLMNYVELMRTINFRFHLSHGGVRNLNVVWFQ